MSNGAVDTILLSLRVYSESPHIVTDSILVEYLSLLLQLSSKGYHINYESCLLNCAITLFLDAKFGFKARQHKALPTITSLLKRSTKKSMALSIILSVVRILANNSENDIQHFTIEYLQIYMYIFVLCIVLFFLLLLLLLLLLFM